MDDSRAGDDQAAARAAGHVPDGASCVACGLLVPHAVEVDSRALGRNTDFNDWDPDDTCGGDNDAE